MLDVPGQGSSSRMRHRSGHDLGPEQGLGFKFKVQRLRCSRLNIFSAAFDVGVWHVEWS